MKKINSLILVVVLVAVAVLSVACTGGVQQLFCDHDFSKCDYLNVYCAKGCGASKRPASKRIYDKKFVYDFTEAKHAEVVASFNAVENALAQAEPYDGAKHAFAADSDYYKANKNFEEKYYNPFSDMVEYVTEQYQYAYVFYCKYDGGNGTKADYETISEVRNEVIADYYKLFASIYDTQYREYFFSEEDGWTADDITVALNMSASYGDDRYVEINNKIDKLSTTYRDFSDSELAGEAMCNLYKQFVTEQNALAALASDNGNKYANYVEYAYANVYERSYTPSDVAEMRNYVKNYFVPVFNKLLRKYYFSSSKSFVGNASKVYKALCDDSIFDNDLTLDYVGKYFAEMKTATLGSKEINFYSTANDLLRNGNYYTGEYEGAFSYYIPAQKATILYFGPDSYSGAFTFVHEFGHYYNTIYNGGVNLSMDHDETQSQGDEMMFLAYLQNNLSQNNLGKVFGAVEANQLFNIASTVLMATAVDEFEQTVYAMDEATLKNADLQQLFVNVMSGYGIADLFNTDYWRYVAVDSPCYYISYAMSALPSLGIYAKAQKDGFDNAKTAYLKLFTFSDNASLAHKDDNGDIVVDATYAYILHNAGLYGAFDVQLYQLLSDTLG